MSAEFFIHEDFNNDKVKALPVVHANQKLERKGIKGFSQKHRGEWTFTERPMTGDTHQALLLNLGEISPCTHEKEKIATEHLYIPQKGTGHFIKYLCECGVEVEPSGFVEVKK